MLPTEASFSAAMDALGITADTHVVVYDRSGIFSAPRTWWTFNVLGHKK
jgi:thiosulfate/3-mercaptopyruvate sulfurtransferase